MERDKGAHECKQLPDWMQRQGSGGSRKFVIAAVPAVGGRSLASFSWRLKVSTLLRPAILAKITDVKYKQQQNLGHSILFPTIFSLGR